MKNIAIFGSTASIGTSTLNVVRENKDLFNIVTLVAGVFRDTFQKHCKYVFDLPHEITIPSIEVRHIKNY